MKKIINTKRYNKLIIGLFLFVCTITIIFNKIDSKNINYQNDKILNHLLNKTTHQNTKLISSTLKNKILSLYRNPNNYLLMVKNKLIKPKIYNEVPTVKEEIITSDPLIYIYNTHQTEEYAESEFLEFTINPTVTIANYIMEDILNENSYKVIIEENSIKEILNKNKWSYSNSYKASRILLEKAKQKNNSLKYFIDIHRDSLTKDRTTIIINEKAYAKLLFIVGLENTNYQKNLDFTSEINNCINIKYPSLSKGIYKKSGPGVNGIYNQDFSPYLILVEIGGYENTTTEVLNSTLAFTECFMEVIENNESKSNN